MRDRLVITGVALAIITTVFSTVLVAGISSSAPVGTSLPLTTNTDAPTASTPSTTPAYPTTITQQLSSTVINGAPIGLAKGLAINGGPGIGHAYGIIKQSTSSSRIGVLDYVTITGIQGTIPGHIDTIEMQAYYNGGTTPYCVKETTFDATGLSSYSTSFTCNYMGAGIYDFKVTVYDDNGTIIGDPTASLSL